MRHVTLWCFQLSKQDEQDLKITFLLRERWLQRYKSTSFFLIFINILLKSLDFSGFNHISWQYVWFASQKLYHEIHFLKIYPVCGVFSGLFRIFLKSWYLRGLNHFSWQDVWFSFLKIMIFRFPDFCIDRIFVVVAKLDYFLFQKLTCVLFFPWFFKDHQTIVFPGQTPILSLCTDTLPGILDM